MKTAVITGANRGIGLELCREFHQRAWQVFAACRRPSPELKALGVHILSPVDVTSDKDVESMRDQLSDRRIDVLINNAGILVGDSIESLDFDSIRRQFEINTLGPLRVTRMLLPLLNQGAKVIMITSRMGSIADNSSGGYYGYRLSKAALNMAGMSLSHDLKKKGVVIGIFHPGFVRTEMTGQQGNISPQDSAKRLCKRIDELKVGDNALFKHADGQTLPW